MDEHYFQPWADAATIVTLLLAILGYASYIFYLFELRKKRRDLEKFLRKAKIDAHQRGWKTPKGEPDTGARTVIPITKETGLSEEEIIKASFRSKVIERLVHTDKATNYATDLLFRYIGEDAPRTPP